MTRLRDFGRRYWRVPAISLRWLWALPLFLGLLHVLPYAPLQRPWMFWSNLWGALAWPLAVGLALILLAQQAGFSWQLVDPRSVVGGEVALWAVLGLASYWREPAPGDVGGGGRVGDALVALVSASVGGDVVLPTLVLMLLLGLALVYLYQPWEVDWNVFLRWWLWARAQLAPWLGWHLPQEPRVQYSPSFSDVRQRLVRLWARRPRARAQDVTPEPPTVEIETGYALPPSNLLERDDFSTTDMPDVRRRARLIRETLAGFGIPVRVVEVHQGPAVTQFCVQPLSVTRGGKKRRVSVRRILAVQNDLALMLAASPIRIEAPVPGKPYVGIEVPNPTISVVRLGGVIASDAFQRMRSPLALALGRDVTGNPIVADLAKLPHLLIAGATGSGKSVAIASMIVTWLMRNTPYDLHLLLIDPKRVELTGFAGIPHLIGPVVTDVEEVLKALTWVMLQMDDRYRMFARARVRHLSSYNNWARRHHKPTLPYLVVVIDELADIMLATKGEVEHMLARLAQMARATGIHLVVATQRPSVDVITGLIKANFPARLAFAVTSQVDSRVILDVPGAETLLGRGDALFHPPDRPAPIRLQGSYVSDEEIEQVVAWWRGRADEEAEVARVPWADITLERGEESLTDRALQVIRGEERVSASFLQRKLHIGFKRAQQLIDELEAMGVVGPDEGGGRGRRVLLDEE